jgi:Uma2 family endonuclease
MRTYYEEVVEGESLLRFSPGPRHELICQRLHTAVGESLKSVNIARLLAPREIVQLSPGTMVRPDLTLVAAATGKPWLIAEVVDSDDHRADTVTKKNIYEELNIPRLWMVDPRYDNIEVYHGSPYGLMLKKILVNKETLQESLLPALSLTVGNLFAAESRAHS